MLEYNKFLKYIKRSDLTDEEIYLNLVKKYGKKVIDEYYETYIDDPSINNETKYLKTGYYLRSKEYEDEIEENLNETKEDEEDIYYDSLDDEEDEEEKEKLEVDEIYSEDPLKQYIKTLLFYAVSEEERIKNIEKLTILKLKQNGKNTIIINKLKSSLSKNGYDLTNLKDYTYFYRILRKILKKLKNQQQNKKIKNLIIYIEAYLECINQEYNEEILNKVYEQNLLLVVNAVNSKLRKILGSSGFTKLGTQEKIDMIQEGNIGFKTGLEKYDPLKGAFTTVAYTEINRAVSYSIKRDSRTIRIPFNKQELKTKIDKMRKLLFEKLGRLPSNEEIAKELNEKVENIVKLEQMLITPVSIYESLDKDSSEGTRILDNIVDEKSQSDIENNVIDKDKTEHRYGLNELKKLCKLSKLSEKKLLVLIFRKNLRICDFMSFDKFYELIKKEISEEKLREMYVKRSKTYTYEEIGSMLGINKNAARMHEISGTEKLETVAKKFKDFDSILNNNKSIPDEKLKKDNFIKDLITIKKIIEKKGISKNSIYYSLETNGYRKGFNFESESLYKALKYYKNEPYRKNLYEKIKIYYNYEVRIERLMHEYNNLIFKVLHDITVDTDILKYTNMKKLSEYGLMLTRLALEKYDIINGDIESYLSTYIEKGIYKYYKDVLGLDLKVKILTNN